MSVLVNFCEIDDLYEHPSLIDPYIIKITVDRKNTKNNHWIKGWVSICGIGPDNTVLHRIDVWAGFNLEKLDKINLTVFQFCQRIGVSLI